MEELQLENENLKKEIKKLKELILEDEALDEDLAAEEEEKEEDPEVQAEAKEKPEESTTDEEMPTMIPAEGDPPVVNEEAMERRKRELIEMKAKARKRREGKKEDTKHVWREVLHTPTEPASASYQHPPEVQQQREEGGKKGKPTGKGEGNKEGEEDTTNKSLHQLQAENYNDDVVLFTDIGIIWKFFKSSNTYQAFKDDKKGGCTTQKHLSKEKANGWIRPTGIVTKEDGLRMTETKKDKRKERQEKDQAKKSSSRIHSSSSKETKKVTKEAAKSRKDKKVILEKEKVARTTTTTRTTRKEKEKESPGGQLTM